MDGNDNYVAPTSSQFSTTCGCSTPTATAADPTCNEGQSFTITSTVVPEAAGCYSDTGVVVEDEALYSETGTDNLPQNFVVAFDAGDADSPDVSKRELRMRVIPRTPPCCYVFSYLTRAQNGLAVLPFYRGQSTIYKYSKEERTFLYVLELLY